jgi:cytosine/adenosine deaminase-related metal-dependent hydrolase
MSVSSALAAHKQYHGTLNNRLEIWFAAGTPRGSPMSAHAAIGAAAKAHDIGITMHCAEAPADLGIFRDQYDCSPLEFCQKTELTSARTVLAHVVHPQPETDYAIMRDTGTTVSHNPTSNCKLGSGVSPVPDMLTAKVNVAMGTDGAPCNNTYDMFREMHLAAILHSGARQTAGVVTAYEALEMATIKGAKALGLDKEIGSLEVGKKADFVIVAPPSLASAPFDVSQLGCSGGQDPITVLVHSCTGADVESVVVDGITVVEQGKLLSINESDVIERARKAILRIRERSGVHSGNKFALRYV